MPFKEGKRYDRQAKQMMRQLFPDNQEMKTVMVPGGFYLAIFEQQNKHVLDIDEEGNVAMESAIAFLSQIKNINGDASLNWDKGLEVLGATSAGHNFKQVVFIPGAPAEPGQANLVDALKPLDFIVKDPDEPREIRPGEAPPRTPVIAPRQ